MRLYYKMRDCESTLTAVPFTAYPLSLRGSVIRHCCTHLYFLITRHPMKQESNLRNRGISPAAVTNLAIHHLLSVPFCYKMHLTTSVNITFKLHSIVIAVCIFISLIAIDN